MDEPRSLLAHRCIIAPTRLFWSLFALKIVQLARRRITLMTTDMQTEPNPYQAPEFDAHISYATSSPKSLRILLGFAIPAICILTLGYFFVWKVPIVMQDCQSKGGIPSGLWSVHHAMSFIAENWILLIFAIAIPFILIECFATGDFRKINRRRFGNVFTVCLIAITSWVAWVTLTA